MWIVPNRQRIHMKCQAYFSKIKSNVICCSCDWHYEGYMYISIYSIDLEDVYNTDASTYNVLPGDGDQCCAT